MLSRLIRAIGVQVVIRGETTITYCGWTVDLLSLNCEYLTMRLQTTKFWIQKDIHEGYCIIKMEVVAFNTKRSQIMRNKYTRVPFQDEK